MGRLAASFQPDRAPGHDRQQQYGEIKNLIGAAIQQPDRRVRAEEPENVEADPTQRQDQPEAQATQPTAPCQQQRQR